MTEKRILRPDRLRQVPPQFSWVDHRLVRQNRLRHCDVSAWALYLFLVTVADAHGLSYYSDASLCRELRLDAPNLVPTVARYFMHTLEIFGAFSNRQFHPIFTPPRAQEG